MESALRIYLDRLTVSYMDKRPRSAVMQTMLRQGAGFDTGARNKTVISELVVTGALLVVRDEFQRPFFSSLASCVFLFYAYVPQIKRRALWAKKPSGANGERTIRTD